MTDKKKILVVDDEEQMLDLITAFLSQAGYEVTAAVDGETALALAGKVLPDLILMDIQLPKIDGWLVCHRLKIDENLKKIPIILFSGMVATDAQADLTVEKCDYLMAKPIELNNLLKKVKEFINPS